MSHARGRALLVLFATAGLLLALLVAIHPVDVDSAARPHAVASPAVVSIASDRALDQNEEAVALQRQEASAAAERTLPCTITGRCVSVEASIPLRGVNIRHLAYPRANARTWSEQVVTTDGDGKFRIVVTAPKQGFHEILLGSGLYCQRRAWFETLEEGEERDLGTIQMQPGTEVRGTLLDESGLPVRGANLLAPVTGVGLPVGGDQVPFVTAATTDDGSFSFGPLPAGDYTLAIAGAFVEIVQSARVTVPAAMTAPVVVTITARWLPLLRVTVMDPHGRPMHAAVVRNAWCTEAGQQVGPFLRTDQNGEALFDASLHMGTVEVWAWASGFAVGKASAPPTGTVQVALEEGESRWLRVRDAVTGRPVQRFTVEHGPVSNVLPPALVETAAGEVRDAGGRCRLDGIRGDHRVLVRADGYEQEEVHLRETEPPQELIVELRQTAELEIVVCGPGPAAAKATLQVVRTVGNGDALSATARVLATGEPVGGRARIRGIPAGSCWVRPAGAWCAPFAHGPLLLAPGERKLVALPIAAGCTISGTIVPPEARALVGGTRLVRPDGTIRLPLAGDGTGFAIDDSGRFRWTGVPPGEWYVEVSRIVESWVEPQARPYRLQACVRVASLQVPAAPETECQIDLRSLLPGTVRGQVVGMAAQRDRGTLRPIGQRAGTRWIGKPVAVEPDGTFAVTLPPGEYRWMLQRGERSDPVAGVLLGQNVEVRAGVEAAATLEVPGTEVVELVFAPALLRSLRGPVWIRYQAAAELRASEYTVGPSGAVQIEIVPGERFLVEAPPHGTLWPERDASSERRLLRYAVGSR